jgi:MOSC domain-containing protein YiiM
VAAGDSLERIATGAPDWSVARAFAALVAGKATRAELAELAELPTLAPKMRAKAAARLG